MLSTKPPHAFDEAAQDSPPKTAAYLPRRARLLAVLMLVAACCCGLARSAPSPQVVNQREAQIQAYRNVKSYVDLSVAQLTARVPELRGLKPVANKKKGEKLLGPILDRVEENVSQFYAKFPDTTSREKISMERIGPEGKVEFRRNETFRYMAIARPSKGISTLVEYRTDMAGKPVQPAGLNQGLVVTKGFASAAIYFLPALRLEAFFRYLGKQKLHGKDTDVIAFAQRPGLAEVPVRVTGQGGTVDLLVQGVAWVDPASYQISRMRIDLLAPSPQVGLMSETTEITFTRIHFPEMPKTVLWLPRTVTVTINWVGKVYTEKTFSNAGTGGPTTVTTIQKEHRTFRNVHRYSHYKLFGSKSKLKF